MLGLPVDYCRGWQGQFEDQVGNWLWIQDFFNAVNHWIEKGWLFCGSCDWKKEVLNKKYWRRVGEGALCWEGGRLWWCYFCSNWWPTLPHSWKEGSILHHDFDDNIWHLGENFQWQKKHISREMVRFKYPEIALNHYTYQHAVDDNNNSQKSPISMDKTWVTSCWPNRVFSFLIGVKEVNILLSLTNIYVH